MAWLESHQSLARHPKLLRLAELLNCSRAAAVGHLHFLWWFAIDYAADGDLSRYTDEEIATGGCWDGDAQQFVHALIVAGFVDSDGARKLVIHDWAQYVGRLIERRAGNADRAKKWRDERRDEEVQRARSVFPANAHGSQQAVRVRERVRNALPTVPNQTRPDQTKPDQTKPRLPRARARDANGAAAAVSTPDHERESGEAPERVAPDGADVPAAVAAAHRLLQSANGYRLSPVSLLEMLSPTYDALQPETEAEKIVDWLSEHPEVRCGKRFLLSWFDRALADHHSRPPPRASPGGSQLDDDMQARHAVLDRIRARGEAASG